MYGMGGYRWIGYWCCFSCNCCWGDRRGTIGGGVAGVGNGGGAAGIEGSGSTTLGSLAVGICVGISCGCAGAGVVGTLGCGAGIPGG